MLRSIGWRVTWGLVPATPLSFLANESLEWFR
jgi:hypothetical protein